MNWRDYLPKKYSTPEEEEKELLEEASKLKEKADHLEKMTLLRKQIAISEKKIKANSTNNILSNFNVKKLLFGVVILIVIVLVIAKSCGG